VIPPVVTREDIDGLDPVVIADVRWYLDGRSGRAAFDAGHVPGAVFVDLDTELAAAPSPSEGRHPLPSPQVFADAMARHGIGPETTVVAYDDAGGMSAGRLVWMLRILGQPAALVDGGLSAWDHGELTVLATPPSPVDRPAVPWPQEALAGIADVTGRDPAAVLVDARTPERYRGEVEPVDPRAGHIPGAVNVPFAGNLDERGRFAPGTTLRERFAAAGIDEGTDVVVYCGSGVSACHDVLAMERAGLPRPRLYVGSWSQWSSDPERPAATG
jgi:thiosulfate/3-mercaptopyruvate sulfurtransferase